MHILISFFVNSWFFLLTTMVCLATPETFAPIAEKVLPSVVSILSDTGKDNTKDQDLLTDWSRQGETYGSGFVVSSDGMIVTNYHNVQGAQHIWVVFANEEKLPARLVGADQETDLAILKIEAKQKLPSLKWGGAREVKVGDWILAVGNPLGLQGSVTAGIISAKAREIQDDEIGLNQTQQIQGFLQTDAAINVGNSGGPMVNMHGEVIGVNTVIVSPSGSNIGIGFAIPSETAQPVVKELIEKGHLSPRIYLGMGLQNLTTAMMKYFDLQEKEGVLIIDIDPLGPAAALDIQEGDLLLAVNDHTLKQAKDVLPVLQNARDEQTTVILTLKRGTQILHRQLVPQMLANTNESEVASKREDSHQDIFPFTVQELQREGKPTVVIERSTHEDSGFFKGAQILAINGELIHCLADYNQAMTAYRKTLKPYLFHLQFQDRKYFAALEVS